MFLAALLACTATRDDDATRVDSGGAARPSRLDLCDALDAPELAEVTGMPTGTLDQAATLSLRRARPHRPGGHAFSWGLVDPARDGHRDWTFPDAAVAEVQARGLQVVATLGNGLRRQDDATVMELSVPDAQREGWLAFVADLAERYDGDGVADMPGLDGGVAAWEVGNEPSCDAGDEACAEAFVTLTDTTVATLRAHAPGAEVYPAGAALPLLLEGSGRENARLVLPWTRWLAQGDTAAVDGLSVHLAVGVTTPSPEEALAWWREHAPGMRLLVGELGTRGPGGVPRVAEDPTAEANWLAEALATSFAMGAERVAWCAARNDLAGMPAVSEVLRQAAETYPE